MAADSSTRTVERALALLGAVCSEGAIALSDAARVADLSPSTALRLLRTLEGVGFVSRDDGGNFRPGASIIQLGALALGKESLVSLCTPAMKRLVATTRESCYLSIPGVGDTGIYIAIVEGTHSIRHSSWVGRSIPLEGTASGQVLKGEQPERGFAVVRSGVEDDVTAIAAPVVMGGRTVASLSIVVPSYRVDELKALKIGQQLVEEADNILTLNTDTHELPQESMEAK
ncbi:IclR family transcriptional regulator [Paenarthrobacter sp. GOM3]|uniref:IclR family transcriptional regulator n=1 Tax=Paenarthrobacter sp. GOM3 TaxID=2782567 RepID=UPI0020121FE2|nr:IclR family transcriptional regulator [Paenarthrobacter sp. GOM3]WOH18434.1 IclR family transcriptional regulator [Paenarthrobacter sp. GOM3]